MEDDRGPFRAGLPGERLLLGRHLSSRLPVQTVAGAALRQRSPVGRRAGVDLQRPANPRPGQVGQGRMDAGQRQQLLAQADFQGLRGRPAETGREGFNESVNDRVHILGHAKVSGVAGPLVFHSSQRGSSPRRLSTVSVEN